VLGRPNHGYDPADEGPPEKKIQQKDAQQVSFAAGQGYDEREEIEERSEAKEWEEKEWEEENKRWNHRPNLLPGSFIALRNDTSRNATWFPEIEIRNEE
jgi:hypothetical protein